MKRALWLTPLALTLVGACSGEGNTGKPERNRTWVDDAGTQHELFRDIPWASHATPVIDADDSNKVVVSSEPVYPPIGANTPDPGSRDIDADECNKLADIELSPYYLDDFEPYDPSFVGMAAGWSGYDDGSDLAFRTPGDVDWYPGLALRYDRGPWGLAADRHVGPRPACGGESNEWVLHYRGGRFNYYGGGMSHALAAERVDPEAGLIHGCPPGESDVCPATFDIFGDPPEGGFKQPHEFWDLSAYDGVVFWARRGPDGATGLVMGLQDKHTSDDLARQNQKFCQRLKVCNPSCENGFSCTPDKEGVSRCMPPDYPYGSVTQNVALKEFMFPRCGESTCLSPSHYQDTDFDGSRCESFSFTGLETAGWCINAGDAPAEPEERSGDAFVSPISLSTDWRLYKLPFDSFRQVGIGKKASSLDLKSLYSIAFQFTVGFTDVYVDNVSFYRNKP